MRIFFTVLFSLSLLLPLHAQTNNEPSWVLPEEPEETEEVPVRTITLTPLRQSFELGIDLGVGLDNDFFTFVDFFKPEIVLDFTSGNSIRNSGLTFNAAAIAGLFFNLKNVNIKHTNWDFGFFAGVDGGLNLNVPKSLFAIITEGNVNQRAIEGKIGVSGGFYAEAGLGASTKFGNLSIGIKPALFSPMLFIPKAHSGINYSIITDNQITLLLDGGVSIYSPFVENGEIKLGADFTLEGEYAFFPFLDVGGSLSHIPVVPAVLRNRMRLALDEFEFGIGGDAMMNGGGIELPELNFGEAEYDTFRLNVFRPMRLNLYARYKPYSSELFTIIPNIGFSVDISNEQGYFNAGMAARFNLRNLVSVSLSTGYMEAVWIHQLGIVFNVKIIELNLKAAVRSASFIGSFKAQGVGVNLGLRLGW